MHCDTTTHKTPGLLSPVVIIGAHGAMGAFFAELLKSHGLAVLEIESDTPNGERRELLSRAHVVLFAVPISATPSIINETLPLVPPNALLVDLTSLKVKPLNAMMQHRGEVLGLHPMCAPSSAGLLNQPVVACRGRCAQRSQAFLELLGALGARVIEMEAERHDRLMAVVQGLNHFYSIAFAHALKALGLSAKDTLQVASPVYELRMDLIGRILAQSPGLYVDIERENPYVPDALKAYLESLEIFKARIEGGTREDCIEFFLEAAEAFGGYRHEALERSNLILAERQRRFLGRKA
jgi:prephenate dehydrogenase